MNSIEKRTEVSNSCCGESSSVSATSKAPSQALRASDSSLSRDILLYTRHLLRDRRVMLGIAAVVLVSGAAFNWGWLVAIGIAPLILAFAPCAAMCALGLCMMGKGNKSVPPQGGADGGAGSGLDATASEPDTRSQ